MNVELNTRKAETDPPVLKEKNILVTGGAGFIGSHLVDALVKRGHNVFVLDNLSSGNLKNLVKNKHLEFIEGDISDLALVDNLVERVDLVYHLAEYIPITKTFGAGHVVKFSVNSPLQDFDVSARGTLIVLNSAKKYHRKFIFTSTAAVYGESNYLLSETNTPMPISPYGASKLCAEEYVKLYSRIYGLPVSIVRFFNVYGPRQSKYVIYDSVIKLSQNPYKIELLGTGEELRDFVYVSDAVKALLLVAQDKVATGQVFNVGSGRQTRIKDLLNKLIKYYKINPEITFKGSSWKGDVKHLTGDISKLWNIGFRPEYRIKDGLKEFMDWFNSIVKSEVV